MRHCERCHNEIRDKEIYGVVGASYATQCMTCLFVVQGPEWFARKTSFICRDGLQLTPAERHGIVAV